MADFTKAQSTSSSSPSSHSGHDMSPSSDMSGMDMSSRMTMTFFTSTSTPLFSDAWSPENEGRYAGTCIFLIILAVVLRFMMAYKNMLEQRWARLDARRIVVAKKSSESQDGETEETEVVEAYLGWGSRPWRWSVDLPRATAQVVLAGVGYLLMLAVMTMNVGYFMSVLGGLFLGELMCGRYIRGG